MISGDSVADVYPALLAAAERVSAFAAAIVVVAFLVAKGVPRGRTRLRRCVILFAVYLMSRGAAFAIDLAERPASGVGVSTYFRSADDALEVLLIINLSAILVFEILLPKLRLDVSAMVHDLVVGGAYMLSAVWVMHRAGFNPTSIVATSAVVTAVIGLSLQATLGNVLGGLAIQMDDSIRIGEWIELEGKVQGQIKEIRWRHTVVETRDWDTLIVPNSTLVSQTIRVLGKRAGRPSPRRMWVHFNVDFQYPPGVVIRAVSEALSSSPIENVVTVPKPQCICYDFAGQERDSFVYYAVRYWLGDIAQDDSTSSVVRERIYAALARAGIPFAIPGLTTFVAQDDEEHRARTRARELRVYLESLDRVELFARLSHDEKMRIADKLRVAPFHAGEVMTSQGATAHWLYILTKGEAEVRVKTLVGIERAVATIRAPSFFGEMALMTGEPREATVIALTETECLRLDKSGFAAIIKARPEVAQEISTILAQRRVELLAVRENLRGDAKKETLLTERQRILASVRSFFALDAT